MTNIKQKRFGENMKFKYYIASILILTILLSIGTLSAIENVNDTSQADISQLSLDETDLISTSNSDCGEKSVENENKLTDSQPSSEDSDLSVEMELGDIVKHTYGINDISFDVPLIITAKVSDSTAKNTKIYLTIPDDFEYVSHEANLGSYDPNKGIWDIGDLSNSYSPKLTIITKISAKGTFSIAVNGTTTSTDRNLSNNDLTCNIQVSSKITSNTTRTSADQHNAQHSSHYGSFTGGGYAKKYSEDTPNEPKATPDSKSEDSQKTQTPSTTDSTEKNSQTKQEESNSNKGNSNSKDNNEQISDESQNSVIKQIDSNIITLAGNAISNTAKDILDPSSDKNDDSNNTKGVVKAIDIYDYTQIPLIIFGLLIVMLIGIFTYDKIKS